MPHRIALVDDHEAIALALRHALETPEDLDYVLGTETVDELLAAGKTVDVVILDLRLADGSSPRRNVERLVNAGARVVIYTSGENPDYLRMIAGSAVVGVVRKSDPVSVLIETVRACATGVTVMSTDWAASIDADPRLAEAGLTEREREVLRLFAAGFGRADIAGVLDVSAADVDESVATLREKYARVQSTSHGHDLLARALDDDFLPFTDRADASGPGSR
ncbi:LuxR C-terminal-related transcriptional regulator [uncultured Schumannella sp.]|uniref:response regulator transcription factor n=1 Tax=uncultured Schumannella sp. TaxID=1195956 RepID=UPI0025D30670|nr:response regulator transcription factor [uncultured Schumannella sp.]